MIFHVKIMTSCNVRWSITPWMRNTDLCIWFLWDCLIDRVLFFFLHWFQRKRISPMHLGLLMHQDSHCALKITFKMREVLFFLKILFQTISCYLKPPSLRFKMASLDGAMILIQRLIILEVLLIVKLLSKSYLLHLYLVISICVTGWSIG